MALDSVPFYSGESNVENFLQLFELEAAKKDWDDAKKVKVIGLCLTGVAKQAFETISADDKKDFNKVSDRLKKVLCKPRDLCIREFQERVMRPNETPASFAFSLENLMDKAYPGLSGDNRKETLQNHFMKSLPAHVRVVVRVAMAKLSWHEIVNLAEEIYRDFTSSNVSGELTESDPKIEIDGELNKMRITGSKRQGRFDGNCYFCGKEGHKEAQCYQKNGNNNKHSYGRNSTYGNGNYNGKWRQNGHPRDRYGSGFRNHSNHHNDSSFDGRSNAQAGYHAKAYHLQLSEPKVDDVVSELEQFNMVELKTLVVEQRTRLIRVDGLLKLKGTNQGCAAKMLVDGGASHSFCNLKVLPKDVIQELESGSSKINVVKRVYNLETATGIKPISCWIGKFLLKINGWYGEQNLIVSNDLCSEEVILGRDFLKINEVLVDHGNDQIQIRSQSLEVKVSVNKIDCVVNKSVEIEPWSEKLVSAKVGKLELNRIMVFEPNENVESKGVKFASSLHKVGLKQGNIVLSVLNPTFDKIKLEKDELVGYLEEAEAVLDDEPIEAKRAELKNEAKLSNVDKNLFKIERAKDSEWLKLSDGRLWVKIKNFIKLENGVLILTTDKFPSRVIVPKHAANYILRIYHDYDLSGHRSFENTLKSIQEKFFWIGMKSYIKNYCDNCDTCQRFKNTGKSYKAPLMQIVVKRPWQLIGIDFMGPLCKTPRGNLYINLERARTKQKKLYDRQVYSHPNFKVDELVLLKNLKLKVGVSKCFQPKFIGPFKIVKIINTVSMVVQTLDGSKKVVVHINRARKYRLRRVEVEKDNLESWKKLLAGGENKNKSVVHCDRDVERVIVSQDQKKNGVEQEVAEKEASSSSTGQVDVPVVVTSLYLFIFIYLFLYDWTSLRREGCNHVT
ncbi:Transposon Ty3-G Gag-Pol poly [Brachionus plicatilis]|uniref:Transposon Ty3-G Gag-Pol poly n=1 Tax=Brachionus plicatilis TaxID=10195 RepID=A0A3M7SLN5_BRAPC|nr:Transposon Ty3-G Gag-Pol poly [Brachionus plicatilis]